MAILACLKNRVKNHSKTDNSVNNQNTKPPSLISTMLERKRERTC